MFGFWLQTHPKKQPKIEVAGGSGWGWGTAACVCLLPIEHMSPIHKPCTRGANHLQGG